MMKSLVVLGLVTAVAPLTGHAQTTYGDCKELQARVIELDQQIVCAEKKGGNARLDYMLERNFMMQLHEASKCSSRKVPEAVMRARAKVKCGR